MSFDPKYSLHIDFCQMEDMVKHLKEYGDFLIANEEKKRGEPLPEPVIAVKNENEKRGKHTKHYHQLAREYHTIHPELSYRECYKIVVAGEH